MEDRLVKLFIKLLEEKIKYIQKEESSYSDGFIDGLKEVIWLIKKYLVKGGDGRED